MAVKVLKIARYTMFLALLVLFMSLTAVMSTTDVKQYPKAISELEEVIVRGLGFQSDDLKITAFDLKDALVGQSVAYEIDLEINNQKKKKSSQRSSVLTPFKLAGPMELWIQDAKKTKLLLPANNIKHAVDDCNAPLRNEDVMS
nr:hypothetical protein [Tanacetum cinerariifolium]